MAHNNSMLLSMKCVTVSLQPGVEGLEGGGRGLAGQSEHVGQVRPGCQAHQVELLQGEVPRPVEELVMRDMTSLHCGKCSGVIRLKKKSKN